MSTTNNCLIYINNLIVHQNNSLARNWYNKDVVWCDEQRDNTGPQYTATTIISQLIRPMGTSLTLTHRVEYPWSGSSSCSPGAARSQLGMCSALCRRETLSSEPTTKEPKISIEAEFSSWRRVIAAVACSPKTLELTYRPALLLFPWESPICLNKRVASRWSPPCLAHLPAV